MTKKKFGWTESLVPSIGQGTWLMKNTKEALKALQRGIELGLTHIDTAEMYEGAEELVGKAIQGKREQVFLVSKVLPSHSSYQGTLEACKRSLKKLRTDYLDLYLLHWWDKRVPLEETFSAMGKLLEDGLIRYAGVSNFEVEELKRAQKSFLPYKIACNQVLYHLKARQLETALLPYCEEQAVALVGYSPFAQKKDAGLTEKEWACLAAIGKKYEKTARQVILAFLTRLPLLFTIPKAASLEHVEENAGASFVLDEEDCIRINTLFPPPQKREPLGWL